MKFAAKIMVMAVVFLLAGVVFARQEINLLDARLLWTSDQGTKITFENKRMLLQPANERVDIYNRMPLRTSSRDYDLLVTKIKTTQPGIAELFWITEGLKTDFPRNFPFYLRRDGKYFINLAAYNRKYSSIDAFMLSFPRGTATVEISELKLVRSNLGEKIIAGWQEFWGPLSRTLDGFDFLVIRSPRLFGRPFNLYLNTFLLIFLVAAIIFKKMRVPFLCILLFCWAVLEVNSLNNNWNSFRKDITFIGKTLEEKRAMVNLKDFYKFIKFCEAAIPTGESFGIESWGMYDRGRAAYYLYPRPCRSYSLEYKPPFFLIYDRKIEENLKRDYQIWKEFRKEAYILKLKNVND